MRRLERIICHALDRYPFLLDHACCAGPARPCELDRFEVATRYLHGTKPGIAGYMVSPETTKPGRNRAEYLIDMGWLMGLEPTTTGITILDSTN